MKNNVKNIIRRIKFIVIELQNYSYSEFQKLLPGHLNPGRELDFSLLDRLFSIETGATLKNYFNQVKIEKARELFYHYRLSPIEVALQLGFKTPALLKKAIKLRNRQWQPTVQYLRSQRAIVNMPKYLA